ncbi:anti-sigma regulatory factor [Romeria aff. gracilis LEGE 07310]|uniref:Anti-sigma regulatory factor n=1 Tax=Vasconcelosia minhoensis LEGE 07310 TaxID=915328 RepID=A0A8J7DPA4_9CYAN|nr:anti-sigma regulatory factor [Romeria gracilis]MBE9079370.1 anti-sigma regulatory factor [Romeria aff. gracilis LEGE 07310]
MVSITSPANQSWESLSFASTLYLCPILDALLEHTPPALHADLRLGLQEALVNAAKHGNQLDPSKTVSVRYARSGSYYWWVIVDQGSGFSYPAECRYPDLHSSDPIDDCGRGLYILYQIFDQVLWHAEGKEVHLCKQVERWSLLSLLRRSEARN